MPFWKNERITPAQVIILGFLFLILGGSLLLTLPFAANGPGGAPFFDALFTATSATCVTGLVIHDTALYWSPFGQMIILLLIQIGGMGVVTMAVAIFMFSGRKIGLKQRWVMQESISAPQVGGIVRQTRFILKTAFTMEGAGALLLALRFVPRFGLIKGLWYAVFHSVSAFCNAGFDLMGTHDGPFASLTAYVGDPLVSLTISALIILGGIGFLTWHDIREHHLHFKHYRLQSKLIFCTTGALLLGGFLFFALYEFHRPQWTSLSAGERILAAVFQSATPRTAGFNTVDLGRISQPGQLLIILLMIIGGAPGSTAGGFKATTLAVLLLSVRAVFQRRGNAQCFGRRLSDDALRSAISIFLLYLLLFLTGGILICAIDEVSLMTSLFETASAIGTVGLSLGSTASLSVPSRLILIFLMYFGRVGGLTLIYAVSANGKSTAQYPLEQVTVG
ncbi:trk system potassium uptake protein TrkH [Oscillibacter sp. PC13]|uniref:TrkH family potassium uptake protein n=1 Tax=Oscillibacter sp. PC13 TaxID=1855299 RepID=UPI0008F3B609|nr:TrkH family potassium uptake protein [Oscillibacter sp. PC13]SFP83729.1 trk system potassium uptake protein TrkH [Oscillibacter sp. PC13]